MKKVILSSLVFLMSLGLVGCFDDKGGNDFESEMPDVKMVLPKSTYSVMKGMTLNIQPIVESDIAESDLKFTWQICGDGYNKNGRKFYRDLVEGKDLNWVGEFNEAITELNAAYEIRLKAEQISTGRNFYSNFAKFSLSGMNGLLLLYGSDQYSEMALLKATEFTPKNSELPEEASVVTDLYEAKTGKKLTGKGFQIGQVIIKYIEYYSADKKAYCRVYLLTDKEGAWLDKDELTYYGGWSSYFRNPEDVTVPKGIQYLGQCQVAFDGDKVFFATFDSSFPWGDVEFTPELESVGNKYTFAPKIAPSSSYPIYGTAYATSVNGDKSHKGFVGLCQSYYQSNGNFRDYSYLLDTKEDDVPFNPSDMKADLVEMAYHEDDHVLAVMKGDASHPSYAGQYFLAEIFPNEESKGESGYAGIPKYLYDISSCEEISNSTIFALGNNTSQCYYATKNTIYQFVADEGTVRGNRKLTNNKGAELEIHGEITCMKFLDESLATTHNTDPILVVCTLDSGKASLYALHINSMTGAVKSYEIYDNSTIEDWNITVPIRDFGMKVL